MIYTVEELQQKYDFLCDAWIRGLCDGHEVESAHRQLQSAITAALANQHGVGDQ